MLSCQSFEWASIKPHLSGCPVEESSQPLDLQKAYNPELLFTPEAFWQMVSTSYYPMVEEQRVEMETGKYTEETIQDQIPIIDRCKQLYEQIEFGDLTLELEQLAEQNQKALAELRSKLPCHPIVKSLDPSDGFFFDKSYFKHPEVLKYFELIGWPTSIEEKATDFPLVTKMHLVPEHMQNNNKCSRDKNDDQCLVCGYDDYEEHDKIIYCESCDVAAHQNCHGIVGEDVQYLDFICMACRAFKSKEKAMSVKCQICF